MDPASFQFSDDLITANYTGNTLTVTIKYPTSRLYSVFPALVLPVIGTVPNLPANLFASSSLQL